MNALDARLLAAHAVGDAHALAPLYREAAAQAKDDTARGFYLTHALVFALEAGIPEAEEIAAQLRRMGRL
ncbi:hypothetical protein [Rhodalgimonas zhirmunskyi]|uniref:Uncharacterized protein n=1 Tax=Rhodalgimonas zhirmunskyi TaxID=2964767 RepID=A0AAJ1X8G5_9RHOB|nr:hypothetical protein [Rhodoalgimonas zhirmunskyi]MDQ2095602.1 hypothetical protein [Rhodoalgimonas zhirmunskyi]